MTGRAYGALLTVEVNRKGVLDVDVVKGCSAGIDAHGEKGCYQACYAAGIAKFRGFDFGRAVVRKVESRAQARAIERAVKDSPEGFFRIGTMGDPSLAWEETVRTVEWLSTYAVPIIITKHWEVATDGQLRRLVTCGAIINTSVSALDGAAHLAKRVSEIRRYAALGGSSVARVVSCDFNTEDPVGELLDAKQKRLFALEPMIDNPLRVTAAHQLVRSGVIRIRKVQDLSRLRTVSIAQDSETYLGHCSGCAELCGAGMLDKPDVRPDAPQSSLFK